MNDATNSCRVDRSQAEQFQARHLSSLGWTEAIRLPVSPGGHSAVSDRPLPSRRRICRQPVDPERATTSRLADPRGPQAHHGKRGLCFAAVSRYVRGLVRTGLLETDLMAAFQARYGNRGWPILAGALQAQDPVAALTLLRPMVPRPARSHCTHNATLNSTKVSGRITGRTEVF